MFKAKSFVLFVVLFIIGGVTSCYSADKYENSPEKQYLQEVFGKLTSHYPDLKHNYPESLNLDIGSGKKLKHVTYVFVRTKEDVSPPLQALNLFSAPPTSHLIVAFFPKEYYLHMLNNLAADYQLSLEEEGFNSDSEEGFNSDSEKEFNSLSKKSNKDSEEAESGYSSSSSEYETEGFADGFKVKNLIHTSVFKGVWIINFKLPDLGVPLKDVPLFLFHNSEVGSDFAVASYPFYDRKS